MTKNLTFRIANTVLFAAMVVVNVLANTLPIGDFNTGQISAMYPTLITPPGWTFAIWGVIYVMLAVFIVRQLVSKRFSMRQDTGLYFIGSCLMNIAWIFSWHYQNMILSTVTILLLLALLMALYQRTRKADLLTKTAFSIYCAWITVASLIMIFAAIKTLMGQAPITPIVPRDAAAPETAAGITVLAENYSGIVLISGNPEIVSYVTVFEYICAIGALVILTIIVYEHNRRYRDPAYLAVILWALAGIMIRQVTSVTPPVLFNIICGAAILVTAYLMIEIFTTAKKGESK